MAIAGKTAIAAGRISIDCFYPNPEALLRLFCFPYAGGSGLIYRSWPESFHTQVEVCALQFPGRGNRLKEGPFTNLSSLVEDAARSLTSYLNKPFLFFGHSMGGLICFELAQKLRKDHGIEPSHLFISGCRAPHIPLEERITYDLPEAEFIKELRRLNGTPAEVLNNPELMQLMLPTIRADFAVCQTYKYSAEPPLSCSITAMGGQQDTDVTRHHLEAWREHTTASFSIFMLPGGHFFIHSAEQMLLEIVTRKINQLVNLLG